MRVWPARACSLWLPAARAGSDQKKLLSPDA